MKKYNLSIWQWIFEVPVLWALWSITVRENRKDTFHEVLKGIERHKCNFIIPHRECGMDWLKCDHEGCNTVIPTKDPI